MSSLPCYLFGDVGLPLSPTGPHSLSVALHMCTPLLPILEFIESALRERVSRRAVTLFGLEVERDGRVAG